MIEAGRRVAGDPGSTARVENKTPVSVLASSRAVAHSVALAVPGAWCRPGLR